MQNEIGTLLQQVHAVITESHIVYTSGKHGSSYVNKDAIYPHPEMTSRLCLQIAEHFVSAGVGIDVVVAPAIGGVILSQWVAFHLGRLTQREVLGVYAEKVTGAGAGGTGKFVIKRGYDLLTAGKRVLVVEDVMTTGGSVVAVIDTVRKLPAEVVGVAALCNRGGLTAQALSNVPVLYSLLEVNFEAWDAADCKLCKQGVPINRSVGKG